MCNAWNHHSGCTCGFGGDGYSGRGGLGGYRTTPVGTLFPWVPPIGQTYESFVNPNARCPVCGATVFFYQSPYGGRVFFDELGPPWPKHPCTDNASVPARLDIASPIPTNSRRTQYGWQSTGWTPFFITAVVEIDRGILEICGTFHDRPVRLYVAEKQRSFRYVPGSLSSQTLALIKQDTSTVYTLSVYCAKAMTGEIKAYRFLSDARKVARWCDGPKGTGTTKIVRRSIPAGNQRPRKNTRKTGKAGKVPGHARKVPKLARKAPRSRGRNATARPEGVLAVALRKALSEQSDKSRASI